MISRAHSQHPAEAEQAPRRRVPQGGAQPGDGDCRGVQAVVRGSIEGRGCGAAALGEVFVCL